MFATPEVSPSSVATPLDLEEELSRALAETSVPPDPPTAAAPVEDRSFEDGLSKLLGRPVRAPAVPAAPPALQQDLADMLAPAPENIVAGEGENAVSDAPPVVDMTSPEDFIEEKSEAILQKHAETMTDVEAEEVADHVQDGAPEPVEPLVSETPSVLPENRDDDLFEDPAPAFSEDGGGLAEQPVVEPFVPPPAPEVPLRRPCWAPTRSAAGLIACLAMARSRPSARVATSNDSPRWMSCESISPAPEPADSLRWNNEIQPLSVMPGAESIEDCQRIFTELYSCLDFPQFSSIRMWRAYRDREPD